MQKGYVPTREYTVVLIEPEKTPEEKEAFDRKVSQALGVLYKRQLQRTKEK